MVETVSMIRNGAVCGNWLQRTCVTCHQLNMIACLALQVAVHNMGAHVVCGYPDIDVSSCVLATKNHKGARRRARREFACSLVPGSGAEGPWRLEAIHTLECWLDSACALWKRTLRI